MTLSIIDTYNRITTHIQKVAQRESTSVPALMVVTKGQSAETLYPLLEQGHRLFGENRVQEALEKWPSLKKQFPDIQLHLIGPLQTNKVKDALSLFNTIETVDRLSLAEKIAKAMPQSPQSVQLLIQINSGAEAQKSGVLLNDFATLLHTCTHDLALPIQGLMAIPPITHDPGPHFQKLYNLAQEYGLKYLSMGMSQDYEIAIRYQASWIRLGTILFKRTA